jgi:hypothetical protein
MDQMAIKYTDIFNFKTHLQFQDPPKFTQIRIFGLKYHLATLVATVPLFTVPLDISLFFAKLESRQHCKRQCKAGSEKQSKKWFSKVKEGRKPFFAKPFLSVSQSLKTLAARFSWYNIPKWVEHIPK